MIKNQKIQSFYSQQRCKKQQPSSHPSALVQLSQKCVTSHQCKRYGAKDENKNNVQACKGSCKVLKAFTFLQFSTFYICHVPLKKI
jgi:hypothetical protein